MHITGITKTLANINLKTMAITGDMERIAYKAGTLIERRAKENISGKNSHHRHIVTGNLRNSIDTRVRKMAPTLVQIEIGTNVHYAAAVEARDATGGYLRPALYESKKQALDYIQRTVAGEVGLL